MHPACPDAGLFGRGMPAVLVGEVMVGNAVSFDELLEAGADLERKVNKAAV